ncbi:MAG TPA: hypothetical protein VIH03_01645 [Nitrososphaerales archaeon]
MVRLEKELRIDEVRLYGEGSQVIATDGIYESEINLGKDAEEEFAVMPDVIQNIQRRESSFG